MTWQFTCVSSHCIINNKLISILILINYYCIIGVYLLFRTPYPLKSFTTRKWFAYRCLGEFSVCHQLEIWQGYSYPHLYLILYIYIYIYTCIYSGLVFPPVYTWPSDDDDDSLILCYVYYVSLILCLVRQTVDESVSNEN